MVTLQALGILGIHSQGGSENTLKLPFPHLCYLETKISELLFLQLRKPREMTHRGVLYTYKAQTAGVYISLLF